MELSALIICSETNINMLLTCDIIDAEKLNRIHPNSLCM